MTKRQKTMLLRIIIGAVLLIAAVLVPYEGPWRFALFLPAYFTVGWDVLWRAVRNIANGQVFDENFLMALATMGAFCTGFFGEGEYPEAVFVMLFYQVGELFQGYAVGKSRRSISSLMDLRPDYANLETDGEVAQVDPEDVPVGGVIVVKPGEKIPLDGTVIEGSSTLNTAALTGESMPRSVGAGESVPSGCVNLSGVLRIRVEKEFGESTVAKILDLVENASSKKARAENFITRFARYYTPAVVIGAVLLAVIPPLFMGGWGQWVQRALTFLVVSCPCALVISVPLSFFGGIGGASRQGILIKGGNYMEALAAADMVVFDKTGTLTQGVFKVTEIHPEGMSEKELLELAALAESWSDHPISRSLKEAWGGEPDRSRVGEAEELSGRGVRVQVDGRTVCAGNRRLMDEIGARCPENTAAGTVVHVAVDGAYAGHIIIADQLKADSKDAVKELRERGIKTVMLTGDSKAAGEAATRELGIDQVHTELMPAGKVGMVEKLLGERTGRGRLAFVGDGINDAPVLSRADVGIAMGALGSDAAIEAADVVLMDDKPSKLSLAIRISRRTIAIVKENIWFALGVKGLVLLLTALGVTGMWLAVFADVGVMVLAVLNATRALSAR
ncbi:heavy metal translocating P-type ATPase [Acutalibacter sp. 1XD8-36]|uniref:heavy metal translocating P-type ATPase n=1 Tax=Acutalibacter sp. 1XD8-36 TaxID=2320852 RepID=UPI0014137092|nr:heavy metal translocating P-type ATPase [Acutalibacter sp. 1XD8-36]NBJ88981.1 cadmium-translocating P-type ATPase [Acutalibacter sp. 1XD8-36]